RRPGAKPPALARRACPPLPAARRRPPPGSPARARPAGPGPGAATASEPLPQLLLARRPPHSAPRRPRAVDLEPLEAGELASDEHLTAHRRRRHVPQPRLGDDGVLVLTQDVLEGGDGLGERARPF